MTGKLYPINRLSQPQSDETVRITRRVQDYLLLLRPSALTTDRSADPLESLLKRRNICGIQKDKWVIFERFRRFRDTLEIHYHELASSDSI